MSNAKINAKIANLESTMNHYWELAVTEADWELAGEYMAKSEAARDALVDLEAWPQEQKPPTLRRRGFLIFPRVRDRPAKIVPAVDLGPPAKINNDGLPAKINLTLAT
jgi:hypothetical protein